eukprot:1791250-Amphidinium_carterae.1
MRVWLCRGHPEFTPNAAGVECCGDCAARQWSVEERRPLLVQFAEDEADSAGGASASGTWRGCFGYRARALGPAVGFRGWFSHTKREPVREVARIGISDAINFTSALARLE